MPLLINCVAESFGNSAAYLVLSTGPEGCTGACLTGETFCGTKLGAGTVAVRVGGSATTVFKAPCWFEGGTTIVSCSGGVYSSDMAFSPAIIPYGTRRQLDEP